MKKISTLLFVAAAMLAAASCGRKETYEFVSFASLANSKYSFKEDAGNVKIPVNVYNADGEVSVTLRLSDDTAIAGTNYNLVSPVNGVLTFEKGETQKEVEIEIINIDGYTGNCKFTLDMIYAGAADAELPKATPAQKGIAFVVGREE